MPIIPKDTFIKYEVPYFLYFGHFGFVFLPKPRDTKMFT